jgi:hypothetical protein
MTTFGIYLVPLTRRYALRHHPTWQNVAHYDTLSAANVAQQAADALTGAFPELALPTFAPRTYPAAAVALRRAVDVHDFDGS